MIFRFRATHILITFSTLVALTLLGFPSDLSTVRAAVPTIPGVWCSSEPGGRSQQNKDNGSRAA